jgi:hypothetical protein
MKPRRVHRRDAGLSLAELLISATLSCVIVVLAAQAWRPAGESILALRDRAAAVAELRIAVETLAQDLGAATDASPTVDGDLRVFREPAVAELEGGMSGGTDAGIVYTFHDGTLVRRDVAPGRVELVAAHLSLFEVIDLGGGETRIRIGAGHGLGERKVTLTWQP